MRIIPAIDIIGGRCVRLSKGDYATARIYSDDPAELAKRFEGAGLRYLHLVDLDGARLGKVTDLKVLEKIASLTSLSVDFSGGIKGENDIVSAFGAGAARVAIGSIAATDRELFLEWLGNFGNERIILGADSRGRMIATSGWMTKTHTDVVDYIEEYYSAGVKYVACTDIEKDGMLQGPSTGLYREILERCGVNLIASGGISSVDDINELEKAGCEGVIIGKALYEGKISAEELGRLC